MCFSEARACNARSACALTARARKRAFRNARFVLEHYCMESRTETATGFEISERKYLLIFKWSMTLCLEFNDFAISRGIFLLFYSFRCFAPRFFNLLNAAFQPEDGRARHVSACFLGPHGRSVGSVKFFKANEVFQSENESE